ncbi:hypothetical protein S7711_10871 [Stachybotrys chartarum IBT 7711]|uniref:Uncharacterized protein n=1 Tax=Stachybotrys chartarum (strain CBS 109288 / IBT 7711) TaxID=1280523 RepID=A0A084B606_STACB|nr:hypothetical protein S7711_10871 [Stachybotrys chartarum IBT 7711]
MVSAGCAAQSRKSGPPVDDDDALEANNEEEAAAAAVVGDNDDVDDEENDGASEEQKLVSVDPLPVLRFGPVTAMRVNWINQCPTTSKLSFPRHRTTPFVDPAPQNP